MSSKKILVIIFTVVCLGITFFVLLLYISIKTKSTRIDRYEPFKEWIGKTVELNRPSVLFCERLPFNDNYPNVLLDSLHPNWQYVDEQANLSEPDLVKIIDFPKGAAFTIQKAVMYTNGVSGSSTPMMFGTITHGAEAYQVGYQWGEQDIGKSFDKIKESWRFHQAPWQSIEDTNYYALPRAEFW